MSTRGSSELKPGVISAVNAGGQSFFVTYDDGDSEDNVSVNMIRVLGKSNLPKLPSVKAVGTFSLKYDDGEVELKVQPSSIRLPAGAAPVAAANSSCGGNNGSSGGAALKVGCKVEGQLHFRCVPPNSN
eukprot:gene28903-35855_t